MELDYKYITVRAYKQPKKGQYRDENCIVDQWDYVMDTKLSDEDNVSNAERDYIETYLKNPNHEVVGSVSAMYIGKEVSHDPIADAEIEAELFKGS
jgi:hypothetical protein|tara:strand:- start:1189 stop:1476 length:288 start_codon:yes stop_codon:yes gene_type:complete